MELYDSTIREIKERIDGGSPRRWGYEPERAWADPDTLRYRWTG